MMEFILNEVKKTREVLTLIEQDTHLQHIVHDIAKRCVTSLSTGGKILFCGNGGSAADSQHLAAELVSRLRYNRPALSSIALTTDTSALTAIGNDYSFESLFARQVEAIGQVGDVLIGISTSGKSPNIMRAFEAAKAKGMTTIGFSGKYTAMMMERCNIVMSVPSSETAKIQECHIMLGHIICAIIEETMFGAQYNPARQEVTEAAVI